MDYVARAGEAARRWREAHGLMPSEPLRSLSSLTSPVQVTEKSPTPWSHTLAREESATKAIKETKGRTSTEQTELGASARPLLCYAAVREVLGPTPGEHAIACLHFDVLQAVRQLQVEIQTGDMESRPLLVRDRPLGDWLDLADVAHLLRGGPRGGDLSHHQVPPRYD